MLLDRARKTKGPAKLFAIIQGGEKPLIERDARAAASILRAGPQEIRYLAYKEMCHLADVSLSCAPAYFP